MFDAHVDTLWLLLIYSVPAEPSRKRAAIWRDIKKIGGIYLRDGVCVLPDRPETAAAVRAIAARVDEFEGQSTVVEGARLEAARAEWVVAQSRTARGGEYAEIGRDAERLLEHVARETEHRDFTFGELDELEADLGKLKRWLEQVRARDHFGAGPDQALIDLLERCDSALAVFLDESASRDAHSSPR